MREAADVIKSSALKTQEEQGEIWTEYELSPNLLTVVTKVVEVCQSGLIVKPSANGSRIAKLFSPFSRRQLPKPRKDVWTRSI